MSSTNTVCFPVKAHISSPLEDVMLSPIPDPITEDIDFSSLVKDVLSESDVSVEDIDFVFSNFTGIKVYIEVKPSSSNSYTVSTHLDLSSVSNEVRGWFTHMFLTPAEEKNVPEGAPRIVKSITKSSEDITSEVNEVRGIVNEVLCRFVSSNFVNYRSILGYLDVLMFGDKRVFDLTLSSSLVYEFSYMLSFKM